GFPKVGTHVTELESHEFMGLPRGRVCGIILVLRMDVLDFFHFSDPHTMGTHYDPSLATTIRPVIRGQWTTLAFPLVLHPMTPNHDPLQGLMSHYLTRYIREFF
ncbi:hypothetical protein HAX54_026435, partial [Datura stramonium]|nr:hypothetical protein [Datura stramonium]